MPKDQKELPGVERETIAAIEEAADIYVRARDKRMKLLEQEITAKANLLNVMLDNEKKLSVDSDGNRIYRFDDEIVLLKEGKRGVKVKRVKDDTDDDDDDND